MRFETKKIGELLSEKGYIRGPFGSSLRRMELKDNGIPVYEQQHAIYDDRNFRFYVDSIKYNELKRFTVKPNDLIISCSGTIGKISLIKKEDPTGIISQALLILRPDEKKILPDFLYYFLSSRQGFNALVAASHGSVQINIAPRNVVENINIPYTNLTEQKEIVNVLKSIDNKIKINQRMSETLEGLAQALFKDWFVDFGPVYAKLQGQDSYLPENLWRLFPTNFNDMGKPVGWEMQRLSQFLHLVYGKSLPARNRRIGCVPVYGSGGITGFHDEALTKNQTIIIGRKGTVGSLYWESRPNYPIDTVFYVEPKAPLSFCYYLLSNFPLRTMNTDAAVPGLNRENVYRLEFPAPPSELVISYAKIADKIRERIDICTRESEILTKFRDALLPKLICGEIRVKDAEIIFRNVT